jgi:hypothetical protein
LKVRIKNAFKIVEYVLKQNQSPRLQKNFFYTVSGGLLGCEHHEASSTRETRTVFLFLSYSPEDGIRSSFQNVILLKYRQWTKSIKPLLEI